MTDKVGPARAARVRKVLRALQDLVTTLPTGQDRDEMHKALESLVGYLRDVQQQLRLIPTRDEFSEAVATIQRLEELLRRAEQNPVVARAIGLEKTARKRPSPAISKISAERAQEILQQFNEMTIDQVRESLKDESKYSLADLKAIASALGIRAQARAGRDSLANQITTRVANTRGYQQLASGGGAQEEGH